MENKPLEQKENEEKPFTDGDTSEYGPLPEWAKELAQKKHPELLEKDDMYRIDHIHPKPSEKFSPVYSQNTETKKSELTLVPLEEGSVDDHMGKDFFTPKPDIWEKADRATPVKKMEKETFGDKRSKKIKKPILETERPSMEFSEGKGDLIKTEEDARRIAAIKEKAEAERRQREQDQRQKEGIYSKIKELFRKEKKEP